MIDVTLHLEKWIIIHPLSFKTTLIEGFIATLDKLNQILYD